MFNYATFIHLSLMLIVVLLVVSLPANLHTTTKLFHCLVAFSPMVNMIHRFVSFQLSLLPNWSSSSSLLPDWFLSSSLLHWSSASSLLPNWSSNSSLLPNWSSTSSLLFNRSSLLQLVFSAREFRKEVIVSNSTQT